MADRPRSSRKAARPRTRVRTLPKPPAAKPNAVSTLPEDDLTSLLAQVGLNPTLQAAHTIQNYAKAMDGSSLDILRLVEELTKQFVAVGRGNLGRAEEMLIAQAHSLDAIFGNLVRRALMQEYMPNLETLLRLGLKAQSQSRATLQTLAEIKNPPNLAFVKQANIGQAVQVNNAVAPPGEGTRVREIESQQSRLLEAQHGERLDIRAEGAAGKADQQVAAVGKINRATNAKRKG